MKIDTVTIRGFRGFNGERPIHFHPSLTLIYGPNSYGKTSITEAVEWLLYGSTSKVDKGESKDEYKGSYRNCHLDCGTTTLVKVLFIKDGQYSEFKAELSGEEDINKYIDGKAVEFWPIKPDIGPSPKPFIMQHALKYLLLVGPDQRFRGFAKLLGLDTLGEMQTEFVSLCTKPESSISKAAAILRQQINALETRLVLRPSLKNVHLFFKKGKDSFSAFKAATMTECIKRVPPGSASDEVLPALLRARDEAVKKVFSGSITLSAYTSEESAVNSTEFERFINFASEDLIAQYCGLVALVTRDAVLKRAGFFKVGMELLGCKPDECPFCGRALGSDLLNHIQRQHQGLKDEEGRSKELVTQRLNLIEVLASLKRDLEKCQTRHGSRVTTFLSISKSMPELEKILSPQHISLYEAVQSAITDLQKLKDELEPLYLNVGDSLNKVQMSIQQSKEDINLIKELGSALITYANHVKSMIQSINTFAPRMSDANQVLKHELDSLAGTEDIGVLIDLTEQAGMIKRGFEIESILESLKELRKTVDQYVGSEMLAAITTEMSGDVMDWYNNIRTTGDPDVHFSGFDMDRTKKGEIKSRRVQIKASSYGKDLVSAVSSLSESKLNALGLCLSIATNLKTDCPFQFIFIDDPIQSWDEEHGVQFIDVVRKLVEKGKQVIVLSHNKAWLERLRIGCRSFNGLYHEITGYTKDGPNIIEKPWCTWKQRLDEVDAILKDNTADSIRLQQAEEEIRIVVCDITAGLYLNKKGIQRNPSTFNSAMVRKTLIECGVTMDLVDRVGQTFETTDDAHHAPKDYAAHRQRIRCYHNWAHALAKLSE
ncbi:AAA domain-containing protein [Dehalogenimonas formicexedens]|uniref:Nuclease SbcCD subunit C n=1 Tax=Dehalogenimonas formicexedens TaxID=1839801 RepID=A0A1P8F9E9_9CHLR|nr:AAA family ATPase [Dehalogenimonas formicexedens]APV45065.1 AAA domain-containing protein [Dehalogenimonas formicexedens]